MNEQQLKERRLAFSGVPFSAPLYHLKTNEPIAFAIGTALQEIGYSMAKLSYDSGYDIGTIQRLFYDTGSFRLEKYCLDTLADMAGLQIELRRLAPLEYHKPHHLRSEKFYSYAKDKLVMEMFRHAYDHGWAFTTIANKAGINCKTIYNLNLGGQNVTWAAFRKIAKALNYSIVLRKKCESSEQTSCNVATSVQPKAIMSTTDLTVR